MHTQKKLLKTSGFTIVELLIVIVVIAILAAISVVAYTGIQERARHAAHQQEASQVEQQIMVRATLEGGGASGISRKLVGYQQGVGERKLSVPLTGTPDITFYVVYDVLSVSGHYIEMPYLTPLSGQNAFRFQTGASGSDALSIRIDTSSQTNLAQTLPGVRIPGSTVICWAQATSTLARASGCNQAGPQSAGTISPHTGWNFTGVLAQANSGGKGVAALVFSAAHDQQTRAAVIGWLAEKYDVTL